MANFWLFLMVGMLIGIPLFIIGLFLFNLIRNAKERRAIKRAIKQGKFLVPIDAKDYDVQAWKENIILVQEDRLENLNTKLFENMKKNG